MAKKSVDKKPVDAPVVSEVPVVEAKEVQKGGKKDSVKEPVNKNNKKEPVNKNNKKEAAKKEPVKKEAANKDSKKDKDTKNDTKNDDKKGGAKKEAASKKNKDNKKEVVKKTLSKKAAAKKSENKDENNEEEDSNGTRSFKVQLPGDTDYTGRFTGLTPYQAANKALSKYFRCQENAVDASTIEFSIKESTRGSRRNTYNYTGARLKLETPITYTIKSVTGEDRVITKQYKNQLTKIKKNPVESKVKTETV